MFPELCKQINERIYLVVLIHMRKISPANHFEKYMEGGRDLMLIAKKKFSCDVMQ